MSYTIRFTETGHERALLSSLSERTAVAFARSESAVYRTSVALWDGGDLVAVFDAGERDTEHETLVRFLVEEKRLAQ